MGLDHRAGYQPEVAEIPQCLAVAVRDPLDAESLTRSDAVQGLAPVLKVSAMSRWDRVAVRVVGRMAQGGVDPLFQPLAHGVLEQLGLGVHLVPRHVQHAHQEGLEQAMAPHHSTPPEIRTS